MKGFQRYVLAGLVTAIPLLITWVVFDVVLGLLARAGGPGVRWLSGLFGTQENVFGDVLLHPWTQWLLAILLTLLLLYLLGLATSRVMGRRLIAIVHRAFARVPFIERIYGAARNFIESMQAKPNQPRQTVLVEFPQKGMKSVGLVTRMMTDKDTGEELAVVYVPTTPIPTSGFLVVVPIAKVVRTDMSFDDAMSFLMTGGTSGPETMSFSGTSPGHTPVL